MTPPEPPLPDVVPDDAPALVVERSSAEPSVPEAAPAVEPSTVPTLSRRRLWAEVAVVAAVVVIPSWFNSVCVHVWPAANRTSSILHWSLLTLVFNLQATTLVLLLIGISREPADRFGLVRWPRFLDVVFACFLVVAYSTVGRACDDLMGYDSADLPDWNFLPRLWARPEQRDWVFLVLVSCTNGFAEEFVFRGFLFARLEQLLGSANKSLLVTTVAFGGCHIYYGPIGMTHVMVGGLLLGLVFLWLRRLWPVALAHAYLDLAPFVYAYS